MEQNNEISPKLPAGPWMGQFTKLRTPKIYNLRADPLERGPDSLEYGDWMAHRMFLLVPAQAVVGQWLESFKDFPPRTKPASFSVSDVMDKLTAATANKN
jgi:arylsulfatase